MLRFWTVEVTVPKENVVSPDNPFDSLAQDVYEWLEARMPLEDWAWDVNNNTAYFMFAHDNNCVVEFKLMFG